MLQFRNINKKNLLFYDAYENKEINERFARKVD